MSRKFHRVCPWVFSLFYSVEARPNPGLSLEQTEFVPGTIPGMKGGTESLCEKNLCAFFARDRLLVENESGVPILHYPYCLDIFENPDGARDPQSPKTPRATKREIQKKNQRSSRIPYFPPNLVAPYCAIPRDYLSDTPLLRAMGFLASQHGQLGAIPHPLSERFPPWRACEVEVRYPPPSKGVSQRYWRDTL